MLRLEYTVRTQWNVGECYNKFAVVNNMVVDKPHHVTLQKQKGEMGRRDAWDAFVCVCGRSSNAANDCGIKRVRVYEEEAGSGPFIWKGRPNSSSFQANQGGMGSTLIGWSESCERSLKGCRGHGSRVQITCPSSLWMTYHYCKVSERARRRGVINVSGVHTFCL